MSGVTVRKYIKTAKMAACSEDFLCGDDFNAASVIFRSYENASKAVEKIATNEKYYDKCSLGVIEIEIEESRNRKSCSDTVEETMMSFIYSKSETRIYWVSNGKMDYG